VAHTRQHFFLSPAAQLVKLPNIDPRTLAKKPRGIYITLAVRRPDLVKGIVIARPAWLFDPGPSNMRPNAYVGELLVRSDRAAALEEFDRSAMAAEIAKTSPDNLSSLRGFFDRANPSVLAALLTRISADGPQLDEAALRKLSIVALVIGTDRDHVHPYRNAEALAGCIPHATLIKITPKSVSREAYLNEFRAALTTFLDQAGS
jgi:pimeloyl-ACP methyl ester carboxylesterase